MGLKYLLDNNILSEPVKPHPNEHVLHKLNQYSGQYCTCVTVWHELHYDVERMTDSKRKKSLFAYLNALEQSSLIVLPYEKMAGQWLAKERQTIKTRRYYPLRRWRNCSDRAHQPAYLGHS